MGPRPGKRHEQRRNRNGENLRIANVAGRGKRRHHHQQTKRRIRRRDGEPAIFAQRSSVEVRDRIARREAQFVRVVPLQQRLGGLLLPVQHVDLRIHEINGKHATVEKRCDRRRQQQHSPAPKRQQQQRPQQRQDHNCDGWSRLSFGKQQRTFHQRSDCKNDGQQARAGKLNWPQVRHGDSQQAEAEADRQPKQRAGTVVAIVQIDRVARAKREQCHAQRSRPAIGTLRLPIAPKHSTHPGLSSESKSRNAHFECCGYPRLLSDKNHSTCWQRPSRNTTILRGDIDSANSQEKDCAMLDKKSCQC